jgi:hypothetical protein
MASLPDTNTDRRLTETETIASDGQILHIGRLFGNIGGLLERAVGAPGGTGTTGRKSSVAVGGFVLE